MRRILLSLALVVLSSTAWGDAGKIIQDSRDLQKTQQRPDTNNSTKAPPDNTPHTSLPPDSPFYTNNPTNNGNNNNSKQPNLFPPSDSPSEAQATTLYNRGEAYAVTSGEINIL